MRVLVTGGAGYIGSHVVKLLRGRGDEVLVVDDLATGLAERLSGVRIERANLADTSSVEFLTDLLSDNRIEFVIHFAARKQVAESVNRPDWYFQQNIGGLSNLVLAMREARVSNLLFSSSAAVYGASEGAALGEDTPTHPMTPYGQSKLVGEWLMDASVRSFGMHGTSLRYFNVAGAGWPELGDSAVLNLVPMVFERLDSGKPPVIFGGDYDTPDGTCIRDFVHVLDLAEAHLVALDNLALGEPRHEVFNIGTGKGSSVREVVQRVLVVAGVDTPAEVRDRRPGDPAIVVADVSSIRERYGWRSRFDLGDIVESAWQSHKLLKSTQ